jgi:hypothetical protein
MLAEEPYNLLLETQKRFAGVPVTKCPSFLREIRNTYIVRAPCDFSARFISKHNKWIFTANGMDWGSVSNEDPVVQFHPFFHHSFFTESKDTTITLLPPYLHTTPAPYFGGSFEIDKWYRNVAAAYLLDERKEYVFNEGTPLYYVRFNKPVKLVQFYEDPEIAYLSDKVMLLKQYVGPRPLQYLYDKFIRSRYNKRLADAIKRKVI